MKYSHFIGTLALAGLAGAGCIIFAPSSFVTPIFFVAVFLLIALSWHVSLQNHAVSFQLKWSSIFLGILRQKPLASLTLSPSLKLLWGLVAFILGACLSVAWLANV
jgi:hypothetical protein